jgi:DNA-binding MarR family transcriptional regulator
VSHPSTQQFLVLHGVRLKGFAEPDALATLWELDESDVANELKKLADAALVSHREGRVSGWSLTPEGRARHAALAAEELDAADAREAVKAAYEEFLGVNPDLLGACTAWQLKSVGNAQVVNEHDDPAYDFAVIEQLAAVHARVRPILDALSDALERFGRYPVRLETALGHVQAGVTEWFTKPLIDSYHTVWFELHEDLLSTLGLHRAAESRA